MAETIVCQQFNVSTPAGVAQVAAFILAQQYANSNTVLATTTYTHSGTAYMIVLVGSSITVGPGTNTVFKTIEANISTPAGVQVLVSQMLTAAYAGMAHLLVFNVFEREAGSAFAVVVMSN
jgi:hypothetical protein